MANYPQLDNASGVWNLREVYDAVMGGYWPNANNRAINDNGITDQDRVLLKAIEVKAIPWMPSFAIAGS